MEANKNTTTRKHAARGILLTGLAQIYRTAVSLCSNILLARLLTPEDFGLIAMVGTCVALVTLIQDVGMGQATIQRARISTKQVSALFWLSAGTSVVLGLALASSAPAIAWFFNEPRLDLLTIAFAVIVVLGGIQAQPTALMTRALKFKALAAIDILTATTGAAGGIIVAWLTASYWALFVSPLIASVVNILCVWLLSGIRPGWPSFEGDFAEIVGFGSSVSGFNIVNYVARNADNLLIGKYWGGEQLGYYDRAYRLLLLPLSQIFVPLGRVVLPLLAQSQSEPQRYWRAYSESVVLLLVVAQPAVIVAIIFANELFRILLGPNWTTAAPIFFYLGIAGLIQLANSPTGWIFLSQGRGQDFLRAGGYAALANVVAFVVGLRWGPVGVAAAYAISEYCFRIPWTWWIVGRKGAIRTRELYRLVVPNFVAASVTGGILVGISSISSPVNAAGLSIIIILSYGIYCTVIFCFPETRRRVYAGVYSFAEAMSADS